MFLTSGFSLAVLVSGSALAQGIYTCVDAKGRKVTSDRPIAECMDRPQQEISPISGSVKRVIKPPPTAAERAEAEEKEKAAVEARAQAIEEKRRERVLVQRYPNKQAHDKERALALGQGEELIKASTKRIQELSDQRKSIGAEMEFYNREPGRAPPALRRRMDENEMGIATQKRVIADQESEKKRVNARFDEELARLRPLWAAGPTAAAAGTTAKN
ncbi:MAG: DUF4124 domain-containing protein [Pseudomonadota bacterium]